MKRDHFHFFPHQNENVVTFIRFCNFNKDVNMMASSSLMKIKLIILLTKKKVNAVQQMSAFSFNLLWSHKSSLPQHFPCDTLNVGVNGF